MLIASALAILAIWIITALALIGIGAAILRCFEGDALLMDAFWVGLAASVAFLEIWSLFDRLCSWATLALLCAGILCLLLNRSAIFARVGPGLRRARWAIVPYIAIVFYMALRASGPCDHYDTGLYGAPAVRWITTFPAVPGLANLHGRLGFNCSVFLCVAAFDHGPLKALAFHLFTGFTVAAIIVPILLAWSRVARNASRAPSDWFYCILAIPMLFWATRSQIVGTPTDEPAAIACLAAAGILFEELCRAHTRNHPGSAARPVRLVAATTIFSLAVSFKESTVAFAFLAWCLAFICICSQRSATSARSRHVLGAVVLSLFVLAPWCARGIVLTGYPLFPSKALGLSVDWKAPVGLANEEVSWIRSWGRDPDAVPGDARGSAWIRPWLHGSLRDRASFQVPLLISLVGFAIALISWLYEIAKNREGAPPSTRSQILSPWLWLLVPSFAAIAFWLYTSPDLRFAQFAIWTAAATLGAWGISSVTRRFTARWLLDVALAALLALAIWCLVSYGWWNSYRPFLAATPFAPLPTAQVVPLRTSSGLTVYVPRKGNQCWNAPLPCTPYFHDALRLRAPGSLRSGFSLDRWTGDPTTPPSLLSAPPSP